MRAAQPSDSGFTAHLTIHPGVRPGGARFQLKPDAGVPST